MRAVHLNEIGSADNFKIVDVPVPDPAEGEVLIKVEDAGVIFADILVRRGEYVMSPPLPFVPGREVSGTVEKVGAGVSDLEPGMRVVATMLVGGYAEYAVAPSASVTRLPDRVSFSQGLIYHINLPVAYLACYPFGKIQPEETILLHAAAGGIGSLITQIAKRRGNNTVIALSSSDEKVEHCRSNGADHCINYRTTDYVEEVLRLTGNKGVDVCLNSVGGPTLETDPKVIRPLGRWVIYGHAAGKGLIDPYAADTLLKSLTVNLFSIYTTLGTRIFEQAIDFKEDWIKKEALDNVSKRFPLEEVSAAHKWMEDQHSYGKITLGIASG